MRVVFALLLLLNLGFWGWRAVEAPRSVVVPSSTLPEVLGNLVLLSELPGESEFSPVAGEGGGQAVSGLLPGGLSQARDQEKLVSPSGEVGAELLSQGLVAEPECWFIGPYPEKSQLPEVGGLSLVEVKVEDFERLVEYWVVMGPFAASSTAEDLAAEIRGKGWDSYVIPSGPLSRGVSVGVFRDRARAERQRQDYLARGYRPRVVPVPKLVERYWLLLRGGASKSLYNKQLALFKGLAQGELEAQKKNCNFVASLKDFD